VKATTRDLQRLEERLRSGIKTIQVHYTWASTTSFLPWQLFAHSLTEPLEDEDEDVDLDEDYQANFP
jgi:hypothetical protein